MSTNVGEVDFDLLLNSNPFNKGLKSTSNNIKSSGIENSLLKIGKLAIAAFSVNAIANFAKSCISLGSDLTEVQNVVDVTFGSLNTQVNEFAQNAITQFGLGQTVAKKYVGTFGSMAESFGFTNQEALNMSETLTGLAGDVASFYNLSSDESYTKLKSVFTGETESLKELGVVMTQTALDQYALQNGYGKTTDKMTEQQKVALRYSFVLDKLKNSSGDFTRTQDSWANQTRVLTLRFNEFKAAIGQGLINAFTPVLKMINNVMASLNVLAEQFKNFTQTIFGDAGGASSSVDSISTSADNAASSINSIGDAADSTSKSLNGLRGIDEINNISLSSDSSSGSSSGGNVSGNTNTAEATKSATALSGLSNLLNSINFNPLINAFNNLKIAATPIIDNIAKGLKWMLDNVLVPLANWTITELLPAFLNLISGALKVLNPIIEAFKPIWQWMWDNFFKPIAEWTGGVIISVINGIADALTNIGNWMSNNQQVVTNMEIAVLGFFGAWKIIELMSFIEQAGGVVAALNLIKDAIVGGTLAKLADKAETVALTLMYAKDFVVSIAQGTAALVTNAAQWVASTAVKIADTAATIAGTVATTAATAATWLFNAALAVLTSPITLVILAIAALVAGIILLIKNWDSVKQFGINCWNGIKGAWNAAASWFNNTIIQPIANFFSNMWNNLKNGASNAWQGIKNVFGSVASWFGNIFGNAWNAVKNVFSAGGRIFDGIKDGIANAFKSIVNTLISGINRVVSIPFNAINSALRLIRNASIGGFQPFSWLPSVWVPQIPYLAEGAYVKANTPQLATIGDNRHQGEVVAPENKLHEIIADELNKNGNGDFSQIISLLKEIIKTLRNENGDIIINVNNIELARAVIKGFKELQGKTNKSIFEFL